MTQLPRKAGPSKTRRGAKSKQSGSVSSAKHSRSTAVGDIVSLDKLKWKAVALPDRLDDAEGFFGLEEIEGVEIIRDAESRSIQYRAVKGKTDGTTDITRQRKRRKLSPGKHVEGSQQKLEDEGEDENEWGGIEDGQPSAAAVDTGGEKQGKDLLKKALKRPTAVTGGKKERKKNFADGPLKHPKQPSFGNAFAGLEEEALEGTDVSAWYELDISAETLISLSKLGFSRPTPIQSAAIAEIRAGHDVIGKASTGSGKTLAFGIPILENFLEHKDRKPGASKPQGETSNLTREPPCALILSPTRELAHQLSKHLTALFSNIPSVGPRIATVTGGLSLQKQQRLLATADVVIGTPGRVWEVISEGTGLIAWLRKTKFLVIDEADRLLSEGHFKEFEEIINVLNQEDANDEDEDGAVGSRSQRQTLVFSATFHKGLQQKLAGKGQRAKGKDGGDLMDTRQSMDYVLQRLDFREERPKFIDVNPVSQMAERLKEGLVECAALEKDLYLYALLLYHSHHRTLIFTNSIFSVRRLTSLLQNLGLGAQALHSQMPQKARLRSVERFTASSTSSSDAVGASSSKHSILVATDVAARGLDIPHVQLVIHYHLPRTADMYVHRSGRTARAAESGASILLCAPEEVVGVRRLVVKVHATAAAAAQDPSGNGGKRVKHYIRSLDLDRTRFVSRLKPRVSLAQTITETVLATEKKRHEDEWMRNAAEELGVDYGSDHLENVGAGRKGRKKAAAAAAAAAVRQANGRGSKADVAALKAQLKSLLSQKINVGVSERYLTAGGIDVEDLLREKENGEGGRGGGTFLGRVGGIGLDDDDDEW